MTTLENLFRLDREYGLVTAGLLTAVTQSNEPTYFSTGE